jgi:tetratricopeptide (TPR) repeat protein
MSGTAMKRLLAAFLIAVVCACVRPCISAEGTTDAASTAATGPTSGEAAVEALFIEGTDAYNKDRDYARALRLMNAVLEAEPNHAGALYYRAMISSVRGDWDEATADIDRALAIDPAEPRFLYMKGRILERQGDTASALEWYSKALEQGFHADALVARIELQLDAGEYQKALDDCGWLIKHQPDARAFILRARASLGLGEYEKALDDCNYALEPTSGIEKTERTAANFLVRAKVLLKLKRADEAYYDLIRASYIEQWSREPILALGDFFLFDRPDMRQAIAYYTAAIEVDAFKIVTTGDGVQRHEVPSARLHRGEAYVRLDAKLFADLALEDFARYIELEPGEPDGYVERAKLYVLEHETDKARADLEKALELDPQNEEGKALLEQIATPGSAPGDATGHADPESHDSEEGVQ